MVFHFPKTKKTIWPKCPLLGHMVFRKFGMGIAKNYVAFKILFKQFLALVFYFPKIQKTIWPKCFPSLAI
jgi:hypothetical protein